MSNIRITIFTPQDLNHSSFLQTAFFEMASIGLLDCNLKIDLSLKPGRYSVSEDGHVKESFHLQPKTSYYLYENFDTNKRIFFAADLYDVPNHFSSYALRNCDIVFKRNYISKYIKYLPIKGKIFPIGLTFGCQSKKKKKWFTLSIAYVIISLKSHLKFDKFFLKRFLKIIKKNNSHFSYVTKGREIDKIRTYQQSVKNQVFYQVRCFPNTDVDFVKEVNDERAYLVKSLKKALGNDYCGGLVPDYVSINNYPNELTFMSTDPNDYLNHIKESSICIYTKGLQNSPARKLPEYLSQGKCIVSERMETELPHNLEEGKHIFFYDNINECINICEKLLKDGELVQQVSKNARRYYEDYLDPVSVGKSIIQHLENEV
jgi:hypothetical protein